MLPLITGIIYDHNRNPVPDGTPVTFIFTVPGEDSNISQQINTTTLNGIARASYRILSSGSLEVRVVSEPALSSKQLRINITSSGVAITAVTSYPTAKHRDHHAHDDFHPHAHPDRYSISDPGTAASPRDRRLVFIFAGRMGRRGRFLLAGPCHQFAALGSALGAAGSGWRFAGLHLPGSRIAGRAGRAGVQRDRHPGVADLVRIIVGLVGRFYLAASGSWSKKTNINPQNNLLTITLTKFKLFDKLLTFDLNQKG